MKIFIFLIALIVLPVEVEARDYNCEKADVVAKFVGDDKYLSPSYFYVKENDRVCVQFTARKEAIVGSMILRVEGLPIMLRGRAGEVSEKGFQAKKLGVYKVVCNGCDQGAEIIVQSAEEFSKKEQELDQMRSLFNRKNINNAP